MNIVISEEEIRAMVKEESDKAIRKRIREMQGDYTSKGYLEEMMREILWETLSERIPDLELFVKSCISDVVKRQGQLLKVPSKSDIIDAVVEELRHLDSC